tara:strand:- start:2286 stop:3062 length:777 start_codon:yes stop_codon:yes gene_type:complete
MASSVPDPHIYEDETPAYNFTDGVIQVDLKELEQLTPLNVYRDGKFVRTVIHKFDLSGIGSGKGKGSLKEHFLPRVFQSGLKDHLVSQETLDIMNEIGFKPLHYMLNGEKCTCPIYIQIYHLFGGCSNLLPYLSNEIDFPKRQKMFLQRIQRIFENLSNFYQLNEDDRGEKGIIKCDCGSRLAVVFWQTQSGGKPVLKIANTTRFPIYYDLKMEGYPQETGKYVLMPGKVKSFSPGVKITIRTETREQVPSNSVFLEF